ncbi:hypothetical protein [Methylocystis sp.]|uniref:hypothetical protein n=1 Tax=Methylocystis sp. TaxID=1911079 RepID=UPI0025D20728|nr:hypothetical protein [Methylocystis sp.]
MTSNCKPEVNDKELVGFATKFLEAYAASAKSSTAGTGQIQNHRPFSFGAGGVIELTAEIVAAQSGFVHRAAKLLKSKAAHEKAISNIAMLIPLDGAP